MMFMGMAPLGALLAGVVAEHLSAPFTVGAGGVVAVAGAIVFGLRWPELRPEARQLVLAQQMVAGNPADEVTAQGEPVPESIPPAR
jgi:predicted membrane channel-forming protein YqfA (hemolysin III family)